MSNTQTKIEVWANLVGFSGSTVGVFRGKANPFHRESISNALVAMGAALVGVTKTGHEIWSTADDQEVVIIDYRESELGVRAPSGTVLDSSIDWSAPVKAGYL